MLLLSLRLSSLVIFIVCQHCLTHSYKLHTLPIALAGLHPLSRVIYKCLTVPVYFHPRSCNPVLLRLLSIRGSLNMPARDNYTDPELHDQVKDEVQESDKGDAPGQWSARKAQFMAQEYKKRGGTYKTDKETGQDELQKVSYVLSLRDKRCYCGMHQSKHSLFLINATFGGPNK